MQRLNQNLHDSESNRRSAPKVKRSGALTGVAPARRGGRVLWLTLACGQLLACQDFTRTESEFLDESAYPDAVSDPSESRAVDPTSVGLPARDAWSEYLATPISDCGEYREGLLQRAMQEPATAAQARAAAPLAAEPTLEKMHESGHFKLYYTTTHTTVAHRVTLDEVKATAKVLNDAWDLYAANFTEPKHYVSGGKKYIDVRIYDLPDHLGITSSTHNKIYLDAPLTVKDPCQRKSTGVHELFHRVQYSYGYITGGIETDWFTEGMASWAEKYAANSVGIWLEKMNYGLRTPGTALFTERANNAIHYWTYLSERVGGEEVTIRDLWECFSLNADLNQSMWACASKQISSLFPEKPSFSWYSSIWALANVRKDFVNQSFYDYSDDEATRSCGGKSYGPLDSVYQRYDTLSLGETISNSETVKSHGSQNWTFNLLTGINKVQVTINEGSSLRKGYNFHLLLISGDTVTLQDNRWNPATATSTFEWQFGVPVDKAILVVVGAPYGGAYDFTIKGLAVPLP